MIGDLGAPELLIIAAIVILLFGVGKVGRLGKDLGSAVREFRSAVRDDKHDDPINLLGSTPSEQANPGAVSVTEERRPPAVF